jgi:gas vesicle protein
MGQTTKCFFYGLGAGFAAGMLMAPYAGIKTRRLLAETARESQERLARESAQLRNSVVDTLNRTTRAAKATAEGMGDALAAGKKQLVG